MAVLPFNMTIRAATHAGSWYHSSKSVLSKQLEQYFTQAEEAHPEFPIQNARVLVGPYVDIVAIIQEQTSY